MTMGKRCVALAAALAATTGITLYYGTLRPWMYTWGADSTEAADALPGDELIAAESRRTTRALTISAPPAMVWSWLVQIGEDRAGFYSYSLLERAVGAKIHNADVIHPEWQQIGVGDTVWLARRYGEGARQIVAAVEPESYLILMSPSDFRRAQRGERAEGAWCFYLRTANSGTRLLVRGSGGAVGHASFDIPHFIMEQKMMRGIRDRVQRAVREIP